jgi:hypothetical protein
MRIILYPALAVLQFSGMAFAEEQYPTDLRTRPVYAGQVLSQTGSEAMPGFGGPVPVVMSGGVEMPNGSEAPVQSASSLPAGFANGTATHAYAQSVRGLGQSRKRLVAQQHDQAKG